MEILIEIILEFVANVVLEWLFGNLPRPSWNRGVAWATFVALVGGLLGLASVLVLPKPIIPLLWVRVAFLIVAPVVIATILAGYTQSRLARGGRPRFLSTWTEAYLFAASFWLVRLVVTFGA